MDTYYPPNNFQLAGTCHELASDWPRTARSRGSGGSVQAQHSRAYVRPQSPVQPLRIQPRRTTQLSSRLTDSNNNATSEIHSHNALTETNTTNRAISMYSRQRAVGDRTIVDDLYLQSDHAGDEGTNTWCAFLLKDSFVTCDYHTIHSEMAPSWCHCPRADIGSTQLKGVFS